MATMNTLNVTLVRSVIGRIEAHKATVRGLGLRRMHHTVTVQDTPAIRGMINTVNYLLNVSSGTAEAVVAKAPNAAVGVKTAVSAKPQAAAKAVTGVSKKYLTKTGADDLTAIEGIGPKIGDLLIAAGIATFAQLASAKISKIEEVLKAAGSRYALAKPGTWPEQAALLAAGKFDEFEKLADELDGGVRK